MISFAILLSELCRVRRRLIPYRRPILTTVVCFEYMGFALKQAKGSFMDLEGIPTYRKCDLLAFILQEIRLSVGITIAIGYCQQF